MTKLYEPVEGEIDHLNSEGVGVLLRHEKKALLVPGTIPGEVVLARGIKREKKGLKAELMEIISASKDRLKPLCPYADICGGCKWQHINYERQIKEKVARIPLRIDRVVPSDDYFFYRNRMDYAFGHDGSLGLKMAGRWWETVDLESCFLLSKETRLIGNLIL